MKISLNRNELNQIDLHNLIERYPQSTRYHLNDLAGQEPYKLYAFLSKILVSHGCIADIGTRFGNSALALSYNHRNYVDSFDINQTYIDNVKKDIVKTTISFFCQDVLETLEIENYDIISLDIDPHDGIKEEKFIKRLIEEEYKGILILDDIGPSWPAMNNMWNNIDLPKWDLTYYGHASGTGLIDFSGKLEIECITDNLKQTI